PLAPGAVSVDTGQPGSRKVLFQENFYALRPPAHGLEIKVATVWTVAWHRSAHAAVVALQVVTGLPAAMQHHVGGTTLALHHPATRAASEYRRIAAPIDEHQILLTIIQTPRHGLQCLGRKALLQFLAAGINQLDLGQRNIGCALR